ncbi:hypothetical protein OC846_003637 [Tilletia horrida]|uniref:PRELI/MSF1 domain-containing protein n=1 Tax=Tilletia horrida TaxID=155126 RepID=A0AAN6JRW2_9BASI|nr:hypothetical protein OC846_003637 [Tilletia horrida]
MVKEFQQHSEIEWPWAASVYAFFERYPNPTATHVLSVDVIDRRIVPRSTPHLQWPYEAPQTSSSAAVAEASTSASTSAPSASPYHDPLVLRTTRLLLKKGTLPKWAPKGLIRNAESWVIEESEVELQPSIGNSGEPKRNMRSWTRNIDHTTVLAVTEATRFKEVNAKAAGPGKGKERAIEPALPPQALGSTRVTTSAQIASQISFTLLRRRIESFGLTRFIAHKDTSREGHIWAIKMHWLPQRVRDQGRDDDLLDELEQRPKRRRIIASAFRPPWLDGLPARPTERLRQWFQNGAWLAPHRQGTTFVKSQVYDDSKPGAAGSGSNPDEEDGSSVAEASYRPGILQRARIRVARWLGYQTDGAC